LVGQVLEQVVEQLFWYVRTSRGCTCGTAGKRFCRTVERDWQNRRDVAGIQSVHIALLLPRSMALENCFSIPLRLGSWDFLRAIT
jgi:hypothetical protein